jgi:4-diphosphocytidyl-2C-methyl-D-erythritol kinase
MWQMVRTRTSGDSMLDIPEGSIRHGCGQVPCAHNELASAAIDQERIMKAVAEADEKKRQKMMPRFTGSGSSSSAPPSTTWCIPH